MAQRDLIGYGNRPPKIVWPGSARLAVQFVLNYEEGGESCILYGDEGSESFLSEIVGAQPWIGARHPNMESLYEYGSRVGFWRLHRFFTERRIPITVFAVASAMEQHPGAVEAMLEAGWEIASHGYRWIDYRHVPREQERKHIRKAIEIFRTLTGTPPLGWYTGRTSSETRHLVLQEMSLLYDSDSYSDDLPFWTQDTPQGKPHLIVPYTLDVNDMRFLTPQGFNSGEHFLSYLKDAFTTLYEEGSETPKMMSIGLHCRIIGKPGRFQALKQFVEFAQNHKDVWFCRRCDVATHWRMHFPHRDLRP